MPIDDLTAWGQIMRKARKEKDLTQQELFRPKPCFCKANRQYRKRENESFLFDFESIGKGPAHLFIDTLINPDVSLEDEGVNQMKMLYSSCPPEMRDTLLHHTQETVKELTELSEKFETN